MNKNAAVFEKAFTNWLSHPLEKYACQIGSSPQVGMNIKII